MKKNKIKGLLLVFVVLGLTACDGAVKNQDSPSVGGSSSESAQGDISFFDDFPEWYQDFLTEEDKQMFLDSMTEEQLEEMREQVEGLDPEMLEGTERKIVRPGEPGEDDCDGGAMQMNENGLECVALEDLDDAIREIIENELND